MAIFLERISHLWKSLSQLSVISCNTKFAGFVFAARNASTLAMGLQFDHFYMKGGVDPGDGLPDLPAQVTLSAGVKFCHVNVSR